MTEAAGEQPAEGSEVLAILKRVQEVRICALPVTCHSVPADFCLAL